MQQRPYIVFFDGVCNLCNSAVRRIYKADNKQGFSFAALQSDFTKRFFAEQHYVPESDSIIVWTGTTFLEQSDAALYIAMRLRFPYPLFRVGYILPKRMRDMLYARIAKRRYGWFGKRDTCMVPDQSVAALFLDQ
ncbi:MAG: DCC1-like thiol-disulfide oxidoreductase family protein [Chitinophagales bacterium]